ncbi:MAG: hypothetical protein ABH950_03985 [Candidatus Altiarchaeota archaeon]
MDSHTFRSIVARVKWRSVFLLIVFVAVVVFLLYLISQNVTPGFTTDNNLGIRVSAEPSTIEIGDSDGAKVSVEVTNDEEAEDVTVSVTAETHDENFVFGFPAENGTKASEEGVVVGPGEIKKVDFQVFALKGAHEGTYLIDVEARKDAIDKVTESIYVKVKKKE